MLAIFIFLLKVNAALLLFCAGYYLVLRHLTFYNLNRVYLMAAILFATIYPQINLSDFVIRHQQIAKPVQAMVLNWQPAVETLAKPLKTPAYCYWIEIIFWIGAALLAARLLVQLYSLYKIYRKSTAALIHNHEVRVIDGDSGPFSFWKSIYINPSNHDPADIKAILLHEQVHVNELHTLDILLAELSTIFYWFNPGVWLIKRAVRENIEFITDSKILKNGADSKEYQYSLVSVSFAAQSNTIVNHFNISTIKKRIIMMNTKRSSKFNLTRYAFLVPSVIVLLLIFSISKAAYIKKNVIAFHRFSEVFKIDETNKTTKPSAVLIHTEKINNKNIDKRLSVNKAINLSDTGKKPKLVFNIKNNEATYIIDGKVADSTTAGKIKHEDIKSINIVQAPQTGYTIYLQTKNGSANDALVKYLERNDSTKLLNKTPSQFLTGRTFTVNLQMNIDTGKIYVHSLTENPLQGSLNFTPASPYKALSENFVSLNHLSDKLIFIDDKIATEKDLKKLSAFDIERLTLKTDEQTKQLYGDKAKNGVVFIVTKKN